MLYPSVVFSGSRTLDSQVYPLVSRVVSDLVRCGVSRFAVGCARGLDSFARSALDRRGVAFELFEAQEFVDRLHVPYTAALALRARASVDSCAGGACVAFFASPSSVGTLQTCRYAAERGLAVYAFACGFSPSSLPSLGLGSWVSVGEGALAGSYLWSSEVQQQSLL